MSCVAHENEASNWRVANDKPEKFNFQKIEISEFPCMLPASANWYCSSIVTCLNGYCAVGGKNAVFIFNLRKSPPVCEWDHMMSSAISTKVTAVSLIQSETSEDSFDFIAAGMDDGLMRIVDFKTKAIYKEHRKHKVKISVFSFISCPLICVIFYIYLSLHCRLKLLQCHGLHTHPNHFGLVRFLLLYTLIFCMH